MPKYPYAATYTARPFNAAVQPIRTQNARIWVVGAGMRGVEHRRFIEALEARKIHRFRIHVSEVDPVVAESIRNPEASKTFRIVGEDQFKPIPVTANALRKVRIQTEDALSESPKGRIHVVSCLNTWFNAEQAAAMEAQINRVLHTNGRVLVNPGELKNALIARGFEIEHEFDEAKDEEHRHRKPWVVLVLKRR